VRHQCLALAKAADPKTVARRIVDGCVSVEMRAACAAEGMSALVAALAVLEVDMWRTAEQPKVLGVSGNGDSVGTSSEVLAVRTVADRHARGIDFGLEFDGAAVTRALNLHCS